MTSCKIIVNSKKDKIHLSAQKKKQNKHFYPKTNLFTRVFKTNGLRSTNHNSCKKIIYFPLIYHFFSFTRKRERERKKERDKRETQQSAQWIHGQSFSLFFSLDIILAREEKATLGLWERLSLLCERVRC